MTQTQSDQNPRSKSIWKNGTSSKKSNGPCQEHNHNASKAILMVPSTSKCRSHIQILEDVPQGRKTPGGLHSNLQLQQTIVRESNLRFDLLLRNAVLTQKEVTIHLDEAAMYLRQCQKNSIELQFKSRNDLWQKTIPIPP